MIAVLVKYINIKTQTAIGYILIYLPHLKKKQIEHFIAEDDTQLVRVIAEIIREAFFDDIQDYSDETVTKMAKLGIKKAKAYGFERAEHIASFVAVMFEISPNFDGNDQIQYILTDENILHDQKFEYMFGRIPEEQWAEMETTYDARTWFPEKEQAEETK